MPIRTRADLRCDGGRVLQERDDLRVPMPLGLVQRRVAILPTGKRGEGRRWRRPLRRAEARREMMRSIRQRQMRFLGHRKNRGKKRQRETEAEVRGYFGEGSRRGFERGGLPTKGEL